MKKEEIIKEFREKFVPYIVKGEATEDDYVAEDVNSHDGDGDEYYPFKCGDIESWVIQKLQQQREDIIKIIEEEKEKLYNDERFYNLNGTEATFGLLSKIQTKIKESK